MNSKSDIHTESKNYDSVMQSDKNSFFEGFRQNGVNSGKKSKLRQQKDRIDQNYGDSILSSINGSSQSFQSCPSNQLISPNHNIIKLNQNQTNLKQHYSTQFGQGI